ILVRQTIAPGEVWEVAGAHTPTLSPAAKSPRADHEPESLPGPRVRTAGRIPAVQRTGHAESRPNIGSCTCDTRRAPTQCSAGAPRDKLGPGARLPRGGRPGGPGGTGRGLRNTGKSRP